MLLLTSVLPTTTRRWPLLAVRQQILNRDRQVMIGIHQSRRRRNDAVPVRVRVVAERHLILIFQPDQPRHRVRTGTVHANLAVMIHGHERERGIDDRIDDLDIESIDGVDRLPVWLRRAAQRIDAHLQSCRTNGIHIDDILQIVDIRHHEILLTGGRRFHRLLIRHALHAGVVGSQQIVGAVFDPASHIGVGRTAVGRVVLEAAVLGRIVRRRNHDSIRQAIFAAAVVNQDGVRDDRRGCNSIVLLNDGLDAVGRQHLQRGTLRGTRHRVRVFAHEERAVGPLMLAVFANGLGDSQDVRFGERAVQRRAAMPAGSEDDHLVGIAYVRALLVIVALQESQIHQHVLGRRFARERRYSFLNFGFNCHDLASCRS